MKTFLAAIALVAMPWSAFAQFLDWRSGTDEKGLPFIYTVNDSGAILGQWCDGELDKCYWMVATATPCKAESQTPAIVNTDSLASAVTMHCSTPRQIGGRTMHRYILSTFDDMNASVKSSMTIALAMPLTGDEFRVMRFSLKGSSLAVRWMDDAKTRYMDSKKKSTRDITL